MSTAAVPAYNVSRKLVVGTNLLFILLSIVFAFLFIEKRAVYVSLLQEDGVVEWLTFAGLFGSAILSLMIAVGIKKRHYYLHFFFFLFFAFALLAGLEEISWGQRIFDIPSNEFFNTYSDQQETNLHNTFQGIAGIKTKHIAMLVLFVYGVVLPLAYHQKWFSMQWLQKLQLVLPPLFLVLPFFIATLFMYDFPSGMEEEIGEFFYSLCFFIMLFYHYEQYRHGHFKKGTQKARKPLKGK